MRISDWSSDGCSSDLLDLTQAGDIQDETYHSILQARSARAALACGLEQLFDFAKVGHGSAIMEYGRKGTVFPCWAFLYRVHEKNFRTVGADRCTDESRWPLGGPRRQRLDRKRVVSGKSGAVGVEVWG